MTFTERERNESWGERATRQGAEARLEGKPLAANPFPRPGHLRTVWEKAWLEEDRILRTGK